MDSGGLDNIGEDAWRVAIADDLFSGAGAGAPLYLFIEQDRFAEIGKRLGVRDGARAHLVACVAHRLDLAGGDPFDYFRTETRKWDLGGKVGPPPCLTLLVVLTLAAESMVADQDYAGHNYYNRLAGLLDLNADETERMKRAFGATAFFWQSFNDWLEEWQGERGFPTARVHDRRKYVGYPISQALVREHDRQSLHAAFERYNLQPMRRMSSAEMIDILNDWIVFGHTAPTNLVRLWADKSTRTRIAGIACDELSHWTGIGGQIGANRDAGSRATKLDWFAEVSLAPLPKLELYLIARADPEEVVGDYRIVAARTDDAGRAAVEACADALKFELLPQMRWASLEPWAHIALTSLFSGAIELERDREEERRFMRSPAPIIVLEAVDERNQYQEVSRIQLFKPALVLAHNATDALVTAHLNAHAREGWRKFTPSDLRNLPAGWSAYLDVMMVRSADEGVATKLEPLCASAATVIDAAQGLQLGHGAWHARRPPELMAASETEGRFDLTLTRRSDGKGLELGQFMGRTIVPLEPLDLPAGDYEVTLSRPTKERTMRAADTMGLRLRTGDEPRPVGVRDTVDRRADLSTGAGLLGVSADWLPTGPALRGCELVAEDLPVPADPDAPAMVLLARPQNVDSPYQRVSRVDAELFVQSCAVRGHHHWICEDGRQGDNFRTLKHQTCQTCHRQEWSRNRGLIRRGAFQRRGGGNRAARVLSDVPRYRRLSEAPEGGFDLLLDALTYLVSGSYERFRAIASDISDEDGFAWRAGQILSALGHIDFEINPETGRPASWRIAPACLVETEDGDWALSGARSDTLIAALREIADANGALFKAKAMLSGPQRIAVAPHDIRPFVALTSPLGDTLKFAPRFSRRLVKALPSLGAATPLMPLFKLPSRETEAFDLDHYAWSYVETRASGAYRVDHHGLQYGFMGPEDIERQVMRVGEVHLVKHLAARQARQSLVHFESERRALLTPMGANLPGVFERVAVMCSARPPRVRADAGLIEYESVPNEVAAALQNKLHA